MSGSNPQACQTLQGLDGQTLDVLIIGGGIVGSGVARDAAMRGMRTALVEMHDFAFGTSSRSSRLLHGGLRYLAQGHVGLVRQASIEKRVIQHIAPHLADPLPFVFPTYRGTPWKRWKLSIGVKLYDALTGQWGNFGKSRTLGGAGITGIFPGIRQKNLTGGVRYFDGLTSDARLVIDTLRSAQNHGATVCNYTKMTDARRDGDTWGCTIEGRDSDTPITVRTRTIVNAAGPWCDRFPQSKASLRLTKGVHLVVDQERLPVPEALVMAQGHRILFAIPWGQRVILGTTDTDYDGPLDRPSCDPEDIDYILKVTNGVFPEAKLSSGDVISFWSGIRPLIATRRQKNGTPSDTSRNHQATMTQPGWFDVMGGKLTTYRLMAEETVNQAVAFLKATCSPCKTQEDPLLPEDSVVGSGVIPPEVSQKTVQHYCQNEWVGHLDDVMVRRTSWAYYHREHLDIARKVVEWMGQELGWDAPTRTRELKEYESLTYGFAGVKKPPPPNGSPVINGDVCRDTSAAAPG